MEGGVKKALRAVVEGALRRLPVSRAICAERDTFKERLLRTEIKLARANARAFMAAQQSWCTEARDLDAAAIFDIKELDPHQLESLIPPLRTADERIQITARCRDADCISKMDNAGAVVDEPDGTRVQIMHNGIKVVAGGYYGDWMQDLIRECKGHHEPQEELVFHEILKHISSAATMIELGGYWSFYSIWFLSQSAARRSLVVEPDPAHLQVGITNARLNRCAPEFIQAFIARDSAEPAPFQTESSGNIPLPAVTVPFLVESRAISHLDILHCDCQGAELQVLESCHDLFAADHIGWVVVSTHSHHISGDPLTHQRCLACLLNAGATIVAEHDVQESFSGDGLIVGKFGPLPPGWQSLRLSYNRYCQSLFRNPLYDLALARVASAELAPVSRGAV
jgi:FkbM family methyltransferase